MKKDRELIEAQRIVRVRVVQVEQLADLLQLVLRHWYALLDTRNFVSLPSALKPKPDYNKTHP